MSGSHLPPLMVSSPNQGGLFLVEGGRVERLDHVDSTGLARAAGAVLVGRQLGQGEMVRRFGDDGSLSGFAPGDTSMDVHDIAWSDEGAFVVATGANAVLRFDAQWRERERLVPVPGEADACHINSIAFHGGRWLATIFGRFTTHRGYKGRTAGAGEVIDLATGQALVHGLSQPHSLVSAGGLLWLCDSEAGAIRCYDEAFQPAGVIELGAYVRGLHVFEDSLVVGTSRSRNAGIGADGPGAQLLHLDHRGQALAAPIALPANEVYDLLVLEPQDLPALRAAALAEANRLFAEQSAGFSDLVQVHEKLQAEYDERTAWAESLDAKLAEAAARHARLQAEYDERSAWATSLDARLAEAAGAYASLEAELGQRTAWAESLESELAQAREALVRESRRAAAIERKLQRRSELIEATNVHVRNITAELEAMRRLEASLRGEMAAREAAFAQREGGMVLARRDLEIRLEEATTWSALLETEVERAWTLARALRDDALARSSGFEAYVAASESRLAALRQAAGRLADDAAERLGRLDAMHVEAHGELARTLQAVLASTSWRITRPLRRTVGLLARRGSEPALPERAPIELPPPDPAVLDAAAMPPARPDAALPAPLLQALDAPRLSRAALPVPELRFPEVDDPLVTIVVPSYGQFQHTLDCLRSIMHLAGRESFEVLLIEDASGDAEMDRFAHTPGLRYHRNPENLGFLRSCNQALHMARGRYFCFLNNDTTVTAGWLDRLVEAFRLRPDAGIVGARLVYPDGRLQEAGGIVWNDASAWNFGRYDDPSRPMYNYLHESDYISGAAILVDAEVFRTLGGFDEHYLPAYCEDTDLAFRARALGRPVYLQPESVVVHHEGVSHGTDTGSGVKAHQVENLRKLGERWKETLRRGHFANGEHVFLARERSQLRRTVLVVDHYAPQPDRDAGSRAMWQLMMVLQRQGMQVKFWPENLAWDPVYAAALQRHGIEFFHGGEYATRGFDDWFAEHGRYFDYVVLSRPHIGIQVLDAVRRHSAAGIVYYGHDIHHLRLREQMKVQPSPGLAADLEVQRGWEERMWRGSDLILYPADGETAHVQDWLAREGVEATARTVPLYAYEATPADPAANLGEREGLLFVAGFAHPPNVDAAQWFVREVLPRIHREHPGLRLSLVGSNPTDEVRALACDHVEVTGYVTEEALAGHYSRARVVVAPLRFGGGMKGKVLEAMHYGIPCVTTSYGVQGMEADTAGFLAACDGAEAAAARILELLADDDEWRRVSRESRDFIARRFSPQAVWDALSGFMDPAPYADVEERRAMLARSPREAAVQAADGENHAGNGRGDEGGQG